MTNTHEQMSELIQHHTNCTRPGADTFHHRLTGTTRTRCRGCTRFVVHEDDVPRDLNGPPPIETGYRCRTHQDVPVTWRGRGCFRCQRDKARKPRPTYIPEEGFIA